MTGGKDYGAVEAESLSEESFGLTVARQVALQGFCVIRGLVKDAQLAAALDDVAALGEDSYLRAPAAMLVDGLLGSQGSSRICDLWPPEGEDSDWVGGEGIGNLDHVMTGVGEMIMPFLQQFGLEVEARTGTVVHEAGMPDAEGPPLTSEECEKWLNVFSNHRLMFVWLLGPGRGLLELQPFDGECNSSEVHLAPGALVVLRADALQHRLVTSGKAFCLTCFFQGPPWSKRKLGTFRDVTPCCEALESWAVERMKEYRESFPEEQAQLAMPRQWELLASHTNFVGQHIAVRSAAIRQPGSWEELAWTSAFSTGPDYVHEVPLSRWDHGMVFDHAGGDLKTNCRHGAFIEGIEMFDNVMFRLSKVEAGGMDPGHRMILETGYQALWRGGYKQKQLLGSRGGVYVARPPNEEWGETEKQSSGVCGGSGSIACGRFSFVHGMKGPCVSIDLEGASSLVAVAMAGTNLSRVGNWEPIPFALATSYNLQTNFRAFLYNSARKVLSVTGRTFSLDGCADGYVRGDCATSLVLKALTDVVDGGTVVNSEEFLGVLAGISGNQSGPRAHITSPDGVAVQEVIAQSIRQADISPLDMDACELHADGVIMADAVEAISTSKALRPSGAKGLDAAPPVALICSKTSLANQLESSGMSSILKVALAAQYGMMLPNVHTRILNLYIDIDMCERPALIAHELLEYNLESSYTGITCRSETGSNANVIVWGHVTQAVPEADLPAADPRGKILFWPEGGGSLEQGQVPKQGYSVAGTWNAWTPEPMSPGTQGTWSFVVTLGASRWERFQILLDGNADKVLHPEHGQASKGAVACGPSLALRSESWLLDGRAAAQGGESGKFALKLSADRFQNLADENAGRPGDTYRIQLHVRGKFRMVDWERVKDAEPKEVDLGSYSLAGTWGYNAVELTAMQPDASAQGLFFAEVHLLKAGEFQFQILRNEDWTQVLCPAEHRTRAPSAETPVLRPDENWGSTWLLQAMVGDVFKIQLQVASAGEDPSRTSVTWTRLRREEPSREMKQAYSAPRMFIAGTWDRFRQPIQMHFTHADAKGAHFRAVVQLGSSPEEGFQFIVDAKRGQRVYPSEHGADPDDDGHTVLGPDDGHEGRRWTLSGTWGQRFDIRLTAQVAAEEGKRFAVSWTGPLESMKGLEEARGRGYLIFCE